MIPVIPALISLALAGFVLYRSGRKPLKRPYLFSAGSFVACGWAMLQELGTVKHRVLAGDVGGIEDTIQAVIIICVVLLIVVALLNLAALALSYSPSAE